MSGSRKLAQLLENLSVSDKSVSIESIHQQSSELFVSSSRITSCLASSRESLSQSSNKTFSLSIKTLFEELNSSVIQFKSLFSSEFFMLDNSAMIMTDTYQQSDSDFRLCREFTGQKDQTAS